MSFLFTLYFVFKSLIACTNPWVNLPLGYGLCANSLIIHWLPIFFFMYFKSYWLFSIKLKYPCSPLKTLLGPGNPAIVKSIEANAAFALNPTWRPKIGTPSTWDCMLPHVCEYIIPNALLISTEENFWIFDNDATAPKPLAVAGLKNFNSPFALTPKNDAISTPKARESKNSLPFTAKPSLFLLSQCASIELKIAAIGWTTAPSWIQSNSRQWIW